MNELFSLEGKVALVTGARSGIGAAIAEGLASAGADLVLHGHRDDLDETARAVEAHGRTATRWIADLSRPEDLAHELDGLLATTRIDVLVNNAGMVMRDPAITVELARWRTLFAVNLDAAFVLAQRIGSTMVERRAGKIVTVASMLSFQGGMNQTAYAASKHGVVGMTKGLSNEWAPFNVQVNALAPGYIATGLTEALTADPRSRADDPRSHTGWQVGRPGRSRRRGDLPRINGVGLRDRPRARCRRRMARTLTSCSGSGSGVEGSHTFREDCGCEIRRAAVDTTSSEEDDEKHTETGVSVNG